MREGGRKYGGRDEREEGGMKGREGGREEGERGKGRVR